MTTIDDDWIPHRRSSDGELVGWIRPRGDAWQAMSLFAMPLTDPDDWDVAEDALENISLSWMAEPWILEREGRGIRRHDRSRAGAAPSLSRAPRPRAEKPADRHPGDGRRGRNGGSALVARRLAGAPAQRPRARPAQARRARDTAP